MEESIKANNTNNDVKMNKGIKFDKIQIKIASPEDIRNWSYGEVTKPETINYRTLKPEKDGLFCEKIFGPTKDWECHCGKYKKIKDRGIICEKCGVEVTKASVRRDRMGHIHLAAPVSHIWYFKGIPSRIGLILDITPKELERVLYFAAYIVLDNGGNEEIKVKSVLKESEYSRYYEQYGNTFRVGMGAEAILELLQNVDLEEEVKLAKQKLEEQKSEKSQDTPKLIKRIEAMEAFISSATKPEWMILTEIPVIPPDLRPMVQLDGGRFATSDLNDLYRRIINRNNRLKRLMELHAPEIIVRNEKRMLQEAVDALIDNGRRNGKPVTGPGNRALKSLSDLLKGKQGRFRQNLLGKRVDYSGRSVIVVGPELKIFQCGLPKEMAVELFKPFVMRELVRRGVSDNVKQAKKSVERLENEIWDVLDDVIKEHPVMLNRAPTLHRLGIQAFEPILVEGKAIKLHPLVCTAFNADFDGDQMAVHLPLSVEAQAECRFMLLSPNNLLKPSDGGPVAVPSQDMVLGIYYLTQERPGAKGEGKFFKDLNEAILAYENGVITLHSKIRVRTSVTNEDGTVEYGHIDSTLGRCLFNEIIPQDLGYVNRDVDKFGLEIDFHVGKKQLKGILQKVINVHGTVMTAEVLDDIKAIGYKYSTKAAMTVSVSEMTVPPIKAELIANAEKRVEQVTRNYQRLLTTVLISRLSSLQVCVVLWRIHQVIQLNFLSSLTSVRVLTFLNTSFQLMVPVRVFLIQLLEQPIQVTLQDDLLTLLRNLSSEKMTVVLTALKSRVCMFLSLTTIRQQKIHRERLFLSHSKKESQEDSLLKTLLILKQAKLSLRLTSLYLLAWLRRSAIRDLNRLRSEQSLHVDLIQVYVLNVTVLTLLQVREFRLVKQLESSLLSQSVSLVHSLL